MTIPLQGIGPGSIPGGPIEKDLTFDLLQIYVGLLAYLRHVKKLPPLIGEIEMVKEKNRIERGEYKILGWKDKLFITGSSLARSFLLLSMYAESVLVEQVYSHNELVGGMEDTFYRVPIISPLFYLALTAVAITLMRGEKKEKPEENLEKRVQHPFKS